MDGQFLGLGLLQKSAAVAGKALIFDEGWIGEQLQVVGTTQEEGRASGQCATSATRTQVLSKLQKLRVGAVQEKSLQSIDAATRNGGP